MACGWSGSLLKRKRNSRVQPAPAPAPLCKHDLIDRPSVPVLKIAQRRQVKLSWINFQRGGLMSAAGFVQKQLVEQLTPEELERLEQEFNFVKENQYYEILFGSTKPFKDECYYILNMLNKIVDQLQCKICVDDQIDEILHGNTVSRHHYDMLTACIIRVLEAKNGAAFTDGVKAASKTFFEYIWEVIEGSQERVLMKQIEEENRRREDEDKKEDKSDRRKYKFLHF